MNELNTLSEKIKTARNKGVSPEAQERAEKDAQNKKVAYQASAEFTGSIIAGVLLGIGIDYWLGTKPWGLITMVFLGMAAGFFNVYRAMNNYGSAIGFAHVNKGLREDEKDDKTPPENIKDHEKS